MRSGEHWSAKSGATVPAGRMEAFAVGMLAFSVMAAVFQLTHIKGRPWLESKCDGK
jgi:hypothetical protein